MAFLDEEEPLSPDDGRGRSRRPDPADQRRQYLVRRLIAVGAGVLVLILLVLGVRGCLDARKERAFENYVNDLQSIARESEQLSNNFFGRLEDPSQLSDLSFESEVNTDRGSAEVLLNRVEGLDPPGEVEDAQTDLVLAFELRRDALAAIAELAPTALGDEGSERATRQITRQMEVFLASDVMYRRAAERIDAVLAEEEVGGEVPKSRFLPPPDEGTDWLDASAVEGALAGVSGEDGDVSGVHGLGLTSVTILPAGTVLEPGTEATVSSEGRAEIQVEVQNQGESTERDVDVDFTLSGDGADIEGRQTISRIEAGSIQTVTLPIQGNPETGTALTLTVNVETVPGEQVADNNSEEYTLTFE